MEGDGTEGAVAGGGGAEAGFGGEEMDDAALAGVHGREAEGLTGAGDFGDGLPGGGGELLVSAEFVAGGVEADAVVLFGGEAEELGGEVLEGVEEFGLTVKEEGDVRAGEVDLEDGGVAIGRRGRTGLGVNFEDHSCGLDVTVEEMSDRINGRGHGTIAQQDASLQVRIADAGAGGAPWEMRGLGWVRVAAWFGE